MTCITQIFILFLLLFVFIQPLTVDIHYYYILELSFYLSLLFSQFTDIRRKVRTTAKSHQDIYHASPIIWTIIWPTKKKTFNQVFFMLKPETSAQLMPLLVVLSQKKKSDCLCLTVHLFSYCHHDSIIFSLFARERLLSASVYSRWCVK